MLPTGTEWTRNSEESNTIEFDNGTRWLRCVQGAPRSFGNAGAEIERMEEPRSRVARTVEDLPTRNEKTTQTTQTHLAHGPGSLHNNSNKKDGRCQDEQTKTSEMNHACELDEPKRIEPGNTSRPTYTYPCN